MSAKLAPQNIANSEKIKHIHRVLRSTSVLLGLNRYESFVHLSRHLSASHLTFVSSILMQVAVHKES